MPLAAADNQTINTKRQQQETKQQKRVRGRRSSKPAMEKRRRARINECLNILKSYVLNDSTNLNRLGIDLTAGENQLDEESIACHILKSSGLINRHRGRKNPNKLEKADILELTVDYVRRLHEQRDELLQASIGQCQIDGQHQDTAMAINMVARRGELLSGKGLGYDQQLVPAHLNEPLTLDLSPKSRQFGQTNTSLTPPSLQAYRPPPNTPITPPALQPYQQPPNTPLTPPSSVSSLLLSHGIDITMLKDFKHLPFCFEGRLQVCRH